METSGWRNVQRRVPSLMRMSEKLRHDSGDSEGSQPAHKDRFADVVLAAVAAERGRVTAAALCCPCYLLVARGGDAARRRLRAFLGCLPYEIINIVVTLYVIFVEDVVVAWLPKSVDNTIEAFTTVALFIFLLDLVLASSVDRKHVFSVFWWIDFLGVVSILLELSWFANLVLPLFMSGAEAEGSQPSIVRIGKAARAGTRAGRMMRLVRMIRLVRIVRLLRFVRRSRSRLSDRAGQRVATQRQALRTTQVIQTATDRSALKRATTARYTCGSELVSACCSVRWRNKQRLRRVDPRREATIAAEQDREEREQASLAHAPRSRVRKRITELIEFKVVIGVIFVLLVLPLLDSLSSSSSATVSGEVELALLDVAHQGDPSSAALVRRQFLELRPDTLELEIDGLAYVSDEARLAELRASEISRLEVGTVSGAFDLSAELREQAIMGFVQTQAIIVLLGVGAGLLSRDVDQLLVQPLERVSRVLRPALPAAIARMGQNFRRWLGRRDGEELSTRLLLAAVESLFADLRPEVEELYRSRERAARFQQGLEAVGKRAGSTRRLRAQRAVVETKESAYAFGSVDDLNASMGTGVRTPGAVGSISGGITPPGLKVFDADTPLTADALDALLSASSRFYVPSDDLYAAIQTGGAEHVHPRRLPGLPMPSAQQVPAKTNLKSAPRPSTIAEDPELPNRSATETGSYSVSMSPSSPIRGSGSTSIPSSAAKDSGRLSEAATEAGRGGERTEHQRSSPADV